ncbi:MAG: gamma-glutamyl-gamma-aminobutyrate hydrolase family protein, partial [Planctomycetota bacterium]
DALYRHVIRWHDTHFSLSSARDVVNSHHHQGVAQLPERWHPLATAEDGLVEAARGPGTFQVGVQWHPEREVEHPASRALMKAFLKTAASCIERSPR